MTDSAAPPKSPLVAHPPGPALIILVLLFTLYVGMAFSLELLGRRAGRHPAEVQPQAAGSVRRTKASSAMSIVPGVTPTIWEFSVRDERWCRG